MSRRLTIVLISVAALVVVVVGVNVAKGMMMKKFMGMNAGQAHPQGQDDQEIPFHRPNHSQGRKRTQERLGFFDGFLRLNLPNISTKLPSD